MFLIIVLFLSVWFISPLVEASHITTVFPPAATTHPQEGNSIAQDLGGSGEVNLIPEARNFRIETEIFSTSSHDVLDGCVSPGEHRLLRFDFWVINISQADLVLGSPTGQPGLFVRSTGHGHYHLKDFNEFTLYDATYRQVAETYKQPFCLFDSQRITGWARLNRRFLPQDCDDLQGISAGWADLYRSRLTCQFVVIDDLPDGEYALLATTNAQEVIPETNFLDNSICSGIRIEGNRVSPVLNTICQDWEIFKVNLAALAPGEVDLCRTRWVLPCHR